MIRCAAGGVRSYDGGKGLSSRKRHRVVDTQGLVLHARVYPANLHDRRAAEAVLEGLGDHHPRAARLFADMGYQGAWATGIATSLAGNWRS